MSAASATPATRAMWLGAGSLRTFAIVHEPPVPTGRGIVICNALGFEGLLAHRPFHHLGHRLAAEGICAARIDYEGTGDAPGDGHGPRSIDAALASIADGVRLLREEHGCTQVSLLGLRAGALLAALAATRTAACELVLWEPVISGARYVRELTATARLAAAARHGATDDEVTGGPLEVVGFEPAPTLVEELRAADLVAAVAAVGSPLARRILLLSRPTRASESLRAALAASGSHVDVEEVLDWDGFMVADETASERPDQTLGSITAWLGAPAADTCGDPAPVALADGVRAPDLEVATVRHDAYGTIDEWTTWIDGRVFAVVSEPASIPATGPEVVLLCNTGSLNRTGPGGLHTQLARRWARAGATVVRVDLGGLGDSLEEDPEADNQPYDEARITEVQQVVAWARSQLGATSVAAFGICSGAYQAMHAALRGAELRHIVLVNQEIFDLGHDGSVATSASKAMIAGHNVLRPRFIRSNATAALRQPGALVPYAQRAGRSLRLWASERARRAARQAGFRVDERAPLAHDLERLAGSGVDVTFVFSSSEPGARYLTLFGGEVLARLREDGRVAVIEIDGGDHVFSPPPARRVLVDVVTARLFATEVVDEVSPTVGRPGSLNGGESLGS